MAPKSFQLVTGPIAPISCHCWSPDRKQVAISPNTNVVDIYNFDGTNYTLACHLEEHTQRVTGIDWSPIHNQIVTCGQDRNAYVWQQDDAGTWNPQLVILRINRAATCVKWSPNGKKFAVGSGARSISVCYYEDDNQWWVSKHVKKPIRSTITSLDWHPNNVLLAAGSTDFKCRVFSTYVKDNGVDEKPAGTNWGTKAKFGQLMGEFSTAQGGGWIHDVSFSSDGEKVAFVAHDSSLYVATGGVEEPAVCVTKTLPYRCVQWVSATNIVAAGWDCMPYMFAFDGTVQFLGELDAKQTTAKKQTFSALAKFQDMDSRGTTAESDLAVDLKTVHQNAIGELSIFGGDVANVTDFCTVGVDGKIVVWNVADASAALASVA
eukprot:m.352137 g.352137  ORF g.352137 m.352137 type:complete len:377 (+) comp16448_c0_seq1:157-1287(+)